MQRTVPVAELSEFIACRLCHGYLIDAVTVLACMHSFCRSCLLRHLATERCCPHCAQLIDTTDLYDNIRTDRTLQTLVYKLVPGLFSAELARREAFHTAPPLAIEMSEQSGEEAWLDGWEDPNCQTVQSEDSISVCLRNVDQSQSALQGGGRADGGCDARYLLCPACLTIALLKKFITLKLDLLHSRFQMAVLHEERELNDALTLLQVAVLCRWERMEPLMLRYMVKDNERMLPVRPESVTDTAGGTTATPTQLSSASDALQNQSIDNPGASESGECQNDSAYEKSPLRALGLVPIGYLAGRQRTYQGLSSVVQTTKLDSNRGSQERSSAHPFFVPIKRNSNSCDTFLNGATSLKPQAMRAYKNDASVSLLTHKRSLCNFSHFKKQMINKSTIGPWPTNHAIDRILAGGSSNDAISCSPARSANQQIDRIVGQSADLSKSAAKFVVYEDAPSVKNDLILAVKHLPLRVKDRARRGEGPSISSGVGTVSSVTTPSNSSPKGKIGIVISHGRAMTLQDKLRMVSACRSKQEGATSTKPDFYYNGVSRCAVGTPLFSAKRRLLAAKSENSKSFHAQTLELCTKRTKVDDCDRVPRPGATPTVTVGAVGQKVIERVNGPLIKASPRRTPKVLHVNNTTQLL